MNKVMLFSPGIDSFVSDYILTKQKCKYDRIYFDIDSVYSSVELDFLNENYSSNYLTKDFRLCLGDFEDKKSFIPNRNMLLITLAQSRFNSDIIYINSTNDDRVQDGSKKFRKKLSETLTESIGKKIEIVSPVDYYEKSELCILYSQDGNDPMNLVKKTFSCFNPRDAEEEHKSYYRNDIDQYEFNESFYTRECFECSACYRKYSSLTEVNIFVPFINKNMILGYFTAMDEKFVHNYPMRSRSICKYFDFNSRF